MRRFYPLPEVQHGSSADLVASLQRSCRGLSVGSVSGTRRSDVLFCINE